MCTLSWRLGHVRLLSVAARCHFNLIRTSGVSDWCGTAPILMIKEILGRDLDNDVCIEGLRGDFASQFSDGDFLQGSCQEVCCGDLAKRASIEGFAEILLRD